MRSCKFESCPGHLKALNISAFSFMYDEIPGIRSVVSPGRQSEAAAPGERRYFFRYPYFDNDDVFTTRETGVFSGILAGEPTYPGRYYPGRVLSQPLRNLPAKVRNPDVRRTSETLRFRCSGPIWQRVWISAGGRGRSGDTGTDGRLALLGNRGLPAKKRKLSFEAGLHDSEWSNVCSMETVECTTMESNASSAIRVLFPDRDERGRIGARTTRFRIHYAPKTKNLTYH